MASLPSLCLWFSLQATIDLHFTASRDGKNWWRPGRRSILPQPAEGDYGGSMNWPFKQMVRGCVGGDGGGGGGGWDGVGWGLGLLPGLGSWPSGVLPETWLCA